MNRLATLLTLPATLLLLAGCSEELEHPATYPVTGTVTQGGKPVAGVDVNFIPVTQKGDSRSARGTTDEDGVYTLHTYFSAAADIEGAVPGEYKVTLYKTPASDTGAAAHGGGFQPGSRQAYIASAQLKSALPEQYATQETTPLTATVTDDDNVIDFQAD